MGFFIMRKVTALPQKPMKTVDIITVTCGHCGSCGGGRHKVIFGKEFNDVCGCNFRVYNSTFEDLDFLKTMSGIRMKECSLTFCEV